MPDITNLPWRHASATQPAPNVRVLTVDDSGRIGLDVWTGSAWYPGTPGAIITHWCPLDAVPRPARHTDAPVASAPKS